MLHAGVSETDIQRHLAAICDTKALSRSLAHADDPIPLLRQQLKVLHEYLDTAFRSGAQVEELVATRARHMDWILQHWWQRFQWPAKHSLLAVGGYGRGELHPYSDVDILILLADDCTPPKTEIEQFLHGLWDLGLDIGHSVRTLSQCRDEADKDVTIATNLHEARPICDPDQLFDTLQHYVSAASIWPSSSFFEAKRQEQESRHDKFNDTGHILEPNIKSGPGGLRDIQTIAWVSSRHFGARLLDDLVVGGFLTEEEYTSLKRCQSWLWRMRFGLHLLSKRNEERLLFDYQPRLAELLGYPSESTNQAVEAMMKRFYRVVMEVTQLNDMLLQLFEEAIVLKNAPQPIVQINERFQTRRNFLEVRHEQVFSRHPSALLEIFLIMAQRQAIKGIRATSLRLMRQHLHLIDDEFRNDPHNSALFMQLLRQPRGIFTQLWNMRRYGVLGQYIPEFGRIEGMMQYDLFHAYTVDEHTLFVLQYMRRFSDAAAAHEHPVASHLMSRLEKPELLYLAGLFHDIAKGRGGDHSELGAKDARAFCLQHGIANSDAGLVAWLVRNHLIMSFTAQRQDISDPQVVSDFAKQVGDQRHLDYLFMLTVADIRATNSNLWNSWRGSLLRELYYATKRMLRRGLENPIDRYQLIEEKQNDTLPILTCDGYDATRIQALWQTLGDDYFLRQTSANIAWQTRHILDQADPKHPLVLLNAAQHQGGTAIFTYIPDQDYLFGGITGLLDQLGLTIVDAQIIVSKGGQRLDTYTVVEESGEMIEDPRRLEMIQQAVLALLTEPGKPPAKVKRRTPRVIKHFARPTQVTFTEDPYNPHRTVLEVVTPDRPGLLAQIGRAFHHSRVLLEAARITTLGAEVEDIFFITDDQHQPFSDPAQQQALQASICEFLDPANS